MFLSAELRDCDFEHTCLHDLVLSLYKSDHLVTSLSSLKFGTSEYSLVSFGSPLAVQLSTPQDLVSVIPENW